MRIIVFIVYKILYFLYFILYFVIYEVYFCKNFPFSDLFVIIFL